MTKSRVFFVALLMAFVGLSSSVIAQKAKPVILVLNGTDAMQFDKKELKVKAGQTIKLTFKHAGKLPKTAMGHNFVLLQQGTDVAAFGSLAAQARDTDYIPKEETSSVIAHSKLLGGGESDTITFVAPKKKGTYPYICSFPGHYALMQGKFIVE